MSSSPRNLAQKLTFAYAVLTTVVTVGLICLGGVVTSTGSGLAVPDWPTSYGYNMFLLPISKWFSDDGIFYEHTHRLVASGLGLMVIGLCWLLFVVSYPGRRQLRWLGVAALVLVCVQGLMGGLRVTETSNALGTVHGCLAQVFLLLVASIALITSPVWDRLVARNGNGTEPGRGVRLLRASALAATILVFLQLMVGATMRHQHAGLAVHDFPLAYGQVWPRVDEESMARINLERIRKNEMVATPFQIHLHMVHRLLALVILAFSVHVALKGWRVRGTEPFAAGLAIAFPALVLVQAVLGAVTVLSNKAVDIATAHVAVGALTLMATGLLFLFAHATLVRAARQGQRQGYGSVSAEAAAS